METGREVKRRNGIGVEGQVIERGTGEVRGGQARLAECG